MGLSGSGAERIRDPGLIHGALAGERLAAAVTIGGAANRVTRKGLHEVRGPEAWGTRLRQLTPTNRIRQADATLSRPLRCT